MDKHIGDRIRELRTELGLTQEQFAKRIGRSKGAVSQWESGTVCPDRDSLLALSDTYKKSTAWFMGDDDEANERPALYVVESNVDGEPVPLKPGRIPVKGSAQLGTHGYFEALNYPTEAGDGYLNIFSADSEAYGLRVVGNSMMPRIKHHEYVLIEPNHEYINGDEVLVCTRDGQCMIKVFTWLRDGQYRFDSINDGDFAPLYVPQEEVERIQYVGAIVKPSRYMP